MTLTGAAACSLCGQPGLLLQLADEREYWRCKSCQLIQVPPRFHLPPAAERAHYQTHENNPAAPGYRTFLDRLCQPLAEMLKPGSQGLDFGSGPGPTLSLLMQERGFYVANFDPFFAPDETLLLRDYDFITLTEVAEHLRQPEAEFARLWQRLRPGGLLAVMTQMTDAVPDFRNWYYRRDPTHICFWSQASFRWLGKRLPGAELLLPGPNLAFLRRSLN